MKNFSKKKLNFLKTNLFVVNEDKTPLQVQVSKDKNKNKRKY